jgi:glycosyltransferase involved in cell wall biosynthesis
LRTLRIALVAPLFLPRVGGVEKHVASLARELTSQGHEIVVYTQTLRADSQIEAPSLPYDVRRFASLADNPNAVFAPALLISLRSSRGQYDIVHAHSYHTAIPLTVAAVVPGFVLTPHFHGGGHTRLRNFAHTPYRVVFSVASRRVAALVAVSHAEADALQRMFPRMWSRIQVIPNGVDAPGKSGRRRPSSEAGGLVLAAGRLESYKRVDVLIRACARVPGTRIVVCGEGPERDQLRRLGAELLGDRCVFPGWVTDDELANLRGDADVIANLSEHEAFGLSGAEALAAGARVLLSDIPAHRELMSFDPHGAISLVPVGEAIEQVAARLAAQLARGPTDPSTLVPLWSDVSQRHVELYESVLGARDGYDRRAK